MTPSLDKSFLEGLKNISKGLSVEWEPEIERWVLWYKNLDSGASFRIWEVHNEDGSYRACDNRLLEMIKSWDMRSRIDDPVYAESEQLRKALEKKKLDRAKRREELRLQSREKGSKWVKAIENAKRGILYENQVYVPTVYSIPSPRESAGLVDVNGRALSSSTS